MLREEPTDTNPAALIRTDWCPIAAVEYLNNEGRFVFEYILKVPDETVQVG